MAKHFVSTFLLSVLVVVAAFNFQNGSAVKLTFTKRYDSEVSPDAVNLKCSYIGREGGNCNKKIVLIQLSKGGTKTIASVAGKDEITYGDPIFKGNILVEGHIDKEPEDSYLSVTIKDAMTEDSGVYTCSVFYLDEAGFMTHVTESDNITINAKDLEDVVRHLLSKTSFLEHMTWFKHNATDKRLAIVETSVVSHEDRFKQLEEKAVTIGSLRKQVADQSKTIDELTSEMDEQKTNLKRLEEMVTQVNTKLAKESSVSAFSAGYSEKDPISVGNILKFRDLIFDMGGDYNRNTGIFTAPKPGLYVFHLVVMTKYNTGRIMANLMVKNSVVASVFTQMDNNHDQSSVHTVASLQAGDQVKPVISHIGKRGVNTIHANPHLSTFTGYLLKAL